MLPKKGNDNVKAEIAANVGIFVIFDGSTRLGEALGSYIFKMYPRCVKLQLAQSLSQANA